MSEKYAKKGFIVHPYETGSGMFDSAYGNLNKTVKSFKTLTGAKTYLKKHGIKTASYDSPLGTKTISILRKKLKNKRRK